MTKQRLKRALLVVGFGALILCACSAKTEETPAADSGTSDPPSSSVDASSAEGSSGDAEDLDACVPTDAKKCRDASFIALGSKCLTKCPERTLICDSTFWK